MTVTEGRIDVAALKRDRPLPAVLAASGVRLSPSGPGRWKGCCPFHDDHRPSLLVDETDQHFHCFACGEHGDAIAFVMRRRNLGFAAACAWLAGETAPVREPGQPTSGHDPRQPGNASRRGATAARRWDRLTLDEQVVMNTAAALYQHCLWREPRALDYLRERGLPDWVIRVGALGYADGHSLEAFLRRRSGLRIAQELGLLRRPARGDGSRPLREFFAGRIVVPEIRGGQCIWLIGRDLNDTPDRPKYLALGGERPVLGVERAAGQSEVYLCEGVFDYLTAVSWHLPAFSPCGTHLPVERLGFLARARVVYGVFDGDAAGRTAAERFGSQLGDRFRPIDLPEGHDLNDLAREPDGRARFFRLLASARRGRPLEETDAPCTPAPDVLASP